MEMLPASMALTGRQLLTSKKEEDLREFWGRAVEMNMSGVKVKKTGKLDKALFLWFTLCCHHFYYPDNLGCTDTRENASAQHCLDNRGAP